MLLWKWEGGGRDVQVGGVMGKPMADSCWCLVESKTILWSTYHSIENREKENTLLWKWKHRKVWFISYNFCWGKYFYDYICVIQPLRKRIAFLETRKVERDLFLCSSLKWINKIAWICFYHFLGYIYMGNTLVILISHTLGRFFLTHNWDRWKEKTDIHLEEMEATGSGRGRGFKRTYEFVEKLLMIQLIKIGKE